MNLDVTDQKMQKAFEVLRVDLATVRTGRAAPSLVENISINVYGGTQRLKILELATISSSDPQTLVLSPFDPSIVEEMQKGILEANVGLTPSNDGNVIRISIPPLSQERRQELSRIMRQKLESGRIMIRQVRHEAMNEIKKQFNGKMISKEEMERLEKEVQRVTDKSIEDVNLMGERKEAELLQI